MKIPTALGLWISLVLPSIWLVDKYAGVVSAIIYVSVTLVVVVSLHRLVVPISEHNAKILALLTFFGTFFYSSQYTLWQTHQLGHGSDNDDALDTAVHELLSGKNTYLAATYLGNKIHHLPGSFLLALPFTLIWTSALQNLFWHCF